MYDVNDYGRMMADPARMTAYTEALQRAVKPGCVVVDVGTGLGVFALLAAKLGARKVYAIDTSPCIEVAREVVKQNGFSDRIELIHKSVFDIELPEKADVLIGDCRGAFTLFGRNLEIMTRARRFLRDGGVMIPLRDELLLSVVQWDSVLEDLERRWRVAGFDWSAARTEGMSSRFLAPDASFDGSKSLVTAAHWATVDYTSLASPNVQGVVRANVEASGHAQFLALSFKCTVMDGIVHGSVPPGPETQVYMPLLLPLDPPVDLVEGEAITIKITALHSKDSYVFAWELRTSTTVRRQMTDARAVHAHHP
jgi:protein arginine N-methyltransferase 1